MRGTGVDCPVAAILNCEQLFLVNVVYCVLQEPAARAKRRLSSREKTGEKRKF